MVSDSAQERAESDFGGLSGALSNRRFPTGRPLANSLGCPDFGARTDHGSPNDENYKDYFAISTRIKSEIQNNQVSGGMVGIFNPSLTARLNGIKEQTESNITVTENKVIIE